MAQVSTARILNELKISPSTLYFLVESHGIEVPTTQTGRYQWDEDSFAALRNITESKQEQKPQVIEKHYKTTLINNRRYLGNKYKLLDFIRSVVAQECSGINTVADIFAGTGAVASAFLDKKVISNDFLYFNYNLPRRVV
jgi:adenine-specific DNA-methyltransferase